MHLDDPTLDRFDHPARAHVLCGYGLLLLALIVVGAAVYGIEARDAWHDRRELRTAALVVGGMALLFGLLGAFLVTLRGAVEVDGERRTISVTKRALGIARRRERPLDGQGAVLLDEREVSSGEGTMTVWPVMYEHPDGALELHRLQDPRQGRVWAERLARRLGVPMVDSTGSGPDVRGHEDLDRGVVERGQHRDLAWPPEHVSARVRYRRRRGDAVTLTVAPAGFSGVTVNGLLLLGVAAWILVACTRAVLAQPTPIAWLFLVFVGVMVAVLAGLGAALVHGTLYGRVRARIDSRGVALLDGGGQVTERVEAEDVERVGPSRDGTSLVVVSDGGTTYLGGGLTPDEVEALRVVVLLALAGDGAA